MNRQAKREAIRTLQEALAVAELPLPEKPLVACEKDANGKLTAASSAYALGYAQSAMRAALQMLGVQS